MGGRPYSGLATFDQVCNALGPLGEGGGANSLHCGMRGGTAILVGGSSCDFPPLKRKHCYVWNHVCFCLALVPTGRYSQSVHMAVARDNLVSRTGLPPAAASRTTWARTMRLWHRVRVLNWARARKTPRCVSN